MQNSKRNSTVGVEISGKLAVFIGLFGAAWIYFDGRNQNIETADMWAVGFFIGMFIPPIIGAVVVSVLYLQKRKGGGGNASFVRQYR
ncbi:hypothetical protein J2752_002570 [Halarchaeum rubridurum]|uniref:Uncharacterized protein n=1 Tax=Halarchaeum rubridurum TaxID=489911 RepID=A0A8T4GSL2_9EURY|nr:hypothetical protein [Halarchaeum rubridurum]MBP1955641.1 hypothetical protein [Halarchaeum rubridurum]